MPPTDALPCLRLIIDTLPTLPTGSVPTARSGNLRPWPRSARPFFDSLPVPSPETLDALPTDAS